MSWASKPVASAPAQAIDDASATVTAMLHGVCGCGHENL
jgi:hypothetical protein